MTRRENISLFMKHIYWIQIKLNSMLILVIVTIRHICRTLNAIFFSKQFFFSDLYKHSLSKAKPLQHMRSSDVIFPGNAELLISYFTKRFVPYNKNICAIWLCHMHLFSWTFSEITNISFGGVHDKSILLSLFRTPTCYEAFSFQNSKNG